MLRKPQSEYERSRSATLLKVKKFLDTEVTVSSYEAGKGRHKGRVGALWVRLSNGKECKVGTGLKDKDRENPPAVGSIITVKYQEITPDGVLRFPVYVGVRPDGNPNQPVPTRKPAAVVPEPAKVETVVEAPKPVPQVTPVVPVTSGGSTMAATAKRYFEFIDGDSKKFWEIWMDGAVVTTCWGKIGTAGQTKPKPFPDEAKAKKEYDKLLAEKTGKGYSEKPRPA